MLEKNLKLNTLLSLFAYVLIMLQLTKFWQINYFAICVCFLFSFADLKYNMKQMGYAILLSALMVLSYVYIDNQQLVVYAGRVLVLGVLLTLLFFTFKRIDNLNLILKCVFYSLCVFNIICFLIPNINEIARTIFSYAGGSSFRVSGFLQGYEFVPYVLISYVAYEYALTNHVYTKVMAFNSILAITVSLFSGRYSVVPISVYLMYTIIIQNRKIETIFGTILALSGCFILFPSVGDNIINTIYVTLDVLQSVKTDTSLVKDNTYEDVVDGQYILSPFTWINELLRPLENLNDYIIPSQKFTQVDPGPSFLLLNLGLLYTLIIYHFYFYSIKIITKTSIPRIVILIVLVIDFKYKTLYSLMPTFWLIALHVNYLNEKNANLRK